MMNLADQEVPAATTELAGLVSDWKFIYYLKKRFAKILLIIYAID